MTASFEEWVAYVQGEFRGSISVADTVVRGVLIGENRSFRVQGEKSKNNYFALEGLMIERGPAEHSKEVIFITDKVREAMTGAFPDDVRANPDWDELEAVEAKCERLMKECALRDAAAQEAIRKAEANYAAAMDQMSKAVERLEDDVFAAYDDRDEVTRQYKAYRLEVEEAGEAPPASPAPHSPPAPPVKSEAAVIALVPAAPSASLHNSPVVTFAAPSASLLVPPGVASSALVTAPLLPAVQATAPLAAHLSGAAAVFDPGSASSAIAWDLGAAK